MEPYTDLLLNEVYELDARLGRKLEKAIADEREAGYQEGWTAHENWSSL